MAYSSWVHVGGATGFAGHLVIFMVAFAEDLFVLTLGLTENIEISVT